MNQESKVPLLLLWGCTGVGKTSLLTAGLFENRARLAGVDWAASSDVDTRFAPKWRNLKNGIHIEATTEPDINLELRFKPVHFADNRCLVIRDIMGLVAHENERADSRELLRQADAVLFVMEWQGRQQHE
jgi:hypothetical protein